MKLPRVPVAENIPGDDMPMFRNLWENLRTLGRWAFAELTEIHQIESDFTAKVASAFDEMVARAGGMPPALSA